MVVRFKFKTNTGRKVRQAVIRALRAEGVGGVRQLFPGDENETLALLYVAEVGNRSVQSRALSILKGCPAVEFAEPEMIRRLIR